MDGWMETILDVDSNLVKKFKVEVGKLMV